MTTTTLTKDTMVNDHIGTVYHYTDCEPGRIERWRKSGQTKVWKTRPDEHRTPVKHGLYSNDYITEHTIGHFHYETECPLNKEGDR